jgi:hypothetical protein
MVDFSLKTTRHFAEDAETIHNAFFDRNFREDEQ